MPRPRRAYDQPVVLRPTPLRRMVPVLCAGVAASATVAGLAAARPGVAAPVLALELNAAPSAPRACEAVRWRFRLVNRSPMPAVLVFSTGQRGDVALLRGAATVHRWSARRPFVQAAWRRTVPAGRVWRFELRDAVRLAPGRYTLVARVTASAAEASARLTLRRAFVLRPGRRSCARSQGAVTPIPPARPPPPPDEPLVRPPAATLSGSDGTTRLAFGSYCWTVGRPGVGMCAEMVQPELREDIPRVAVRLGETLTIRLRLQPEWIAVFLSAPGATRRVETPLEPTVAWEVPADLGTDARLLVVAAEGSAGAQGFGQATYLAWLVPSPTG